MKISYMLPPTELTNDELEKFYNSPGWTADKIYRKTGIKKRHVVTDELVSDLAVSAAEKLFSEYRVERTNIDFILLCTQTPDYFLPTTACVLQNRLGIPTTSGALDFNLGCSGFVYGLVLADGLIATGKASNVLLITSETYSRHIHPLDKSTRTIFGDGAAAILIQSEDIGKLGEFVLGTDGSGAFNLVSPVCGISVPQNSVPPIEQTDERGNVRTQHNLYMNGLAVSAFALTRVPGLVNKILEKNKMNLHDIDYFIFHQASRFLLEKLRDNLAIPKEKFCIDLEDIGNTTSPTIPIALKRAIDSGNVTSGMKIMLVGFGVGYSWGGTVITI